MSTAYIGPATGEHPETHTANGIKASPVAPTVTPTNKGAIPIKIAANPAARLPLPSSREWKPNPPTAVTRKNTGRMTIGMSVVPNQADSTSFLVSQNQPPEPIAAMANTHGNEVAGSD